MGTGTNFPTTIYISGEEFRNKYEVKAKIEELTDYLVDHQKTLLMLAAGGTSLVPEEDKNLKLNFLKDSVNNSIDSIIDYSNQIIILEWYLDYLEEKELDE